MSFAIDPLTSYSSVKSLLGLTDDKEQAALSALIPMVSDLICRDCKRNLFLAANPGNPCTQYLSGNNRSALTLYDGPVQCPVLTGVTTLGSPTVTGLASVNYLFPGQSVACANFPQGTAVVSVGTGSVTLSKVATASGSGITCVFGIGCWLDATGYGGAGSGAFTSPDSQLYEGQDFTIRRDGANGTASASGILERINDAWTGRQVRGYGGLSSYRTGGLSNLKVTYWAGEASLPPELELAAVRVIGKVRNSKWWGDLVAGESFGDQSYTLQAHTGEVYAGLLDGDVAPILSRYRRVRWGGSR